MGIGKCVASGWTLLWLGMYLYDGLAVAVISIRNTRT